jgi:hypothetical protein
MRKCLLLLVVACASCSAEPTVPNSCFQYQSGISITVGQSIALLRRTCIAIFVPWSTVDTGLSGPSISFTTFDGTNVAPYTGFPLGTCGPSGSGTSCGITWYSGPAFAMGQHVYITGNSTCNGDYVLTGVSSMNIQFSPACTGTGGMAMNSCGSALPQGAQPCKILIFAVTTNNSGAPTNPDYIFSQTWATTVTPAWTANTQYTLHSSVINGGTYYYETNLGPGGPCTSGTAFSTTSDGTCAWTVTTTGFAFLQEAAVGNGLPGGSNAPGSGSWSNGGVTVQVGSNKCTEPLGCQPGDLAAMMPLSWETPFLSALQNFCVGTGGFLPHYTSTIPASQLLALECGAPYGIEWFGALASYFMPEYLMSVDQWEGTYIGYANGALMWPAIHNYYVGNPPAFSMLVPDGVYAGCSGTQCSSYSDYIAQQSLQFAENNPGYLGLRVADVLNYSTGVPILGDWINLASQYRNRSLYFIEPLSVSCPSGSSGCTTLQMETGDLSQTLPFAMQHLGQGTGVPIVMLFGYDDVCPWDSTFMIPSSSGLGYQSCASTSYQQSYQPAELNTAAGLPWFTSNIGGTASAAGNASIQ